MFYVPGLVNSEDKNLLYYENTIETASIEILIQHFIPRERGLKIFNVIIHMPCVSLPHL